jgi:hypothetical protein
MYLRCLAQQVDIVCGDGNQAWYFRSQNNRTERTDAIGHLHSEPLNGLVNTVARFEVSRLNRGSVSESETEEDTLTVVADMSLTCR